MKIKRFNESLNSSPLKIIEDHFSSIVDDLDDICEITFKKVNETLFVINIRPLKPREFVVIKETENLDQLDNWIDYVKAESRILPELKTSMRGLLTENIVEDFEIKYDNRLGYVISIYTIITEEVKDWIEYDPDNYSVIFDKNRFKKLINDKFGVKIQNSLLIEDVDRYGDLYIYFSVTFENAINFELAVQIQDFIMKTESNGIKVFVDCRDIKKLNLKEIKNLTFYTHSDIIYLP